MSHETPSPDSAAPRDAAAPTVAQLRECGPGTGLLVGLLIGGLMWLLLFQFEPQHPDRQPFSMPAEVAAKTEGYVVPPREIQLEIELWERRVALLNDVFFLGLFGLLLAAGFGIAYGIRQKSPKTVMSAGAWGGLIGCGLGLCAGLAGHYAFKLLPEKTEMDSLVITIVAQGMMLSILGLGVGLAFGVITGFRHGVMNVLTFGLIAGIFSSLVFAVASSIFTPNTDTFAAIPDAVGLGRLLWCILVGAAVGFLVPAARSRKSRAGRDTKAASTPVTSAVG